MASTLDIFVSEHGPVTCLHLSGMLDGETHIELEEVVNEILESDTHNLVFNLSQLSYIASNGIGIFIRSQAVMNDHGGRVILTNPHAAVREVFNILGLAAVFSISDDLEGSLSELGAPSV